MNAEQVLFRYSGDATTDDIVTVTLMRLDREAVLTVGVQPHARGSPNRLRLSSFPDGASICLLIERQMTRANHHRPSGRRVYLPFPEGSHDGPLPLSALVILVHTG